ncbi:nitric oxide reductase activation protein [Pullulanibacillus pueri]|uniref:VWFA domain-containing protein n=1 Tax=Pullulanibacillus pueri TaxID=1437324 RepID=A0A8J3EMQ9_9BACL|nr:VWA domain-containing protein [Pullulanibacillus pueri]MBM7680671.1 nitric oxide reductase activation protein [Pullulanibacillus pueri]GGH83785.1 hypothetical protein GCM10007096_25350 [Pullulanibacillus pueri]
MKFFNNLEPRTDPFIKLSLTDLAQTLSEQPNLEVEYAFHSAYKPHLNRISIAHYWDRLLDERKKDGMKTDVYLRAFGQIRLTHFSVVKAYLMSVDDKNHPLFRKQLYFLLDDLRLEQRVSKERPGMKRAFNSRRDLLQKRYRERLQYHLSRHEALDALFCAIYLQLTERPVALPTELAYLKPHIRNLVAPLKTSLQSEDIIDLTEHFCQHFDETLADMHTAYLNTIDFEQHTQKEQTIQENHDVVSVESKEVEDKEDKHTEEETLPSWHQEQEQNGDNFLHFDLDEGSATDLLGEGEREAESGDQAFASVQGQSQQTEGNQFDKSPSLKKETTHPGGGAVHNGYANVNQAVQEHIIQARKATLEELHRYQQIKSDIASIQKGLQRSIQRAIEQKQNAPRSDLYFGRMGKKLLRVLTEDNPRLFVKKQAESKELDVTFSLLVDSSASMYDKMDETHEGLVLFHEALKSLNIPHAVTGFWEDALKANQKEQPNIFKELIPFEKSLLNTVGVNLLQIEPEEDNRDGYAIRFAAKKLLRRPEKRKILLVFTDGEPSAFHYEDKGIVDTHQAVNEARKQGLEVIGVFLGSQETATREKETMKSIYGRTSLVIPSIEEIPGAMIPLLKKLLLND